MEMLACSLGEGIDGASSQKGRIALGTASIVLQLETDATGQPLAAARKVVIGLRELSHCQLRRGLWSDRVVLRPSSLASFGGVPGAYLDEMTIRFDKRDRRAVRDLVTRLSNAVVGNTFDEDDELDEEELIVYELGA